MPERLDGWPRVGGRVTSCQRDEPAHAFAVDSEVRQRDFAVREVDALRVEGVVERGQPPEDIQQHTQRTSQAITREAPACRQLEPTLGTRIECIAPLAQLHRHQAGVNPGQGQLHGERVS